jgi:putative MFS transporter
VDERQLSLLGAVALAALFESFDQAMLTQAVKHIADDFGVGEGSLGSLLGWVRIGAIPALLLIPFADRIGRRRLFLVSVAGMSLATAGSAFAPDVYVFVALQMVSRLFMVTISATAFVIVSEEITAVHRGWGVGMLGALGTFGIGLSAIAFSAIDVVPFGWRAMYALGAVPLVLLPWLRRRVPETQRFETLDAARRRETERVAWWAPLAQLVRAYPARAAGMLVVAATSSASIAVAYNFSAWFVQAEHGWAPGQYSLLLLTAGVAGVIGSPFAGRLADTRGRRLVGCLFFGALPPLAYAFYHGPGWALPLTWIPMVFTISGGNTIARALATELFPTSYRGTASGAAQLVETLGAAGALFSVSWLAPTEGGTVRALSSVVFASWLAAACVLALPETGRRELESISAER